MEIHTPKHPIHSWRELLKEVGIIVLGVLIALAAEQGVEALHWRHKVGEAEDSMRLELRDDDAPQAYTRASVSRCLDAQLDTIRMAIENGRDRGVIARMTSAYRPPNRTWDSEAWAAAIASDVASHTSADRMITWSKPYRIMPFLQATNVREQEAIVDLQPARQSAGTLSSDEATRMLRAVTRARYDNGAMTGRSLVLLVGAHINGIVVPAAEQQRILSGLRAQYGGCVHQPSISGVDPNDQLSATRRK